MGIYRESMWHWKRPMDQFLKGTEEMLKGALCGIVDETFDEYRQTELPGTIKAAVETVMTAAMDKVRILADDCLANETSQHATLNTDGLNAAKKQTRAALDRRGLELVANNRLDQTENPNRATSGKERDAKVKTMIERGDVNSHPYGREMQVLAEVQAWYKIAANRFVDLVYLALRRIVFGHIAAALAAEVEGRLRLNDDDGRLMSLLVPSLFFFSVRCECHPTDSPGLPIQHRDIALISRPRIPTARSDGSISRTRRPG